MPHLAVALPIPDSDLANAEWGMEQTDEELEGVEYLAATQGRGSRSITRRDARDERHDAPTDLATLRAEVATIVAGGRGAGPAWPIGVPGLDAALGGGVPRGRVTEVVGALGAGKTSLVRQLVARVLAEGGWVAWIDATRTLAPQELAGLGERLIVVRPRDHTRGAWCADLLLRSGVFALVVMDGAPVLSRTVGVRLSQLARERDAAFVVLREGTQGSRLGGAVRLQVKTQMQARFGGDGFSKRRALDASKQRSYSVLVEKGGLYRTVEVTCAIVVARRVCADTEIPDRRGVARRTRAAVGAEQGHDQAEQSVQSSESVRAEPGQYREQAAIESSSERTSKYANIVRQHAIDAANDDANSTDSKRERSSEPWKGRGRPRMAESGYGRSTRRGEARKFLHTRERDRRERQDTERNERHASKRESRRELKRYTDRASLGQLPTRLGGG